MNDFKFIVGVAPDEECILELHRMLAQGLINKHGADVMEKVLEIAKDKKIDKLTKD